MATENNSDRIHALDERVTDMERTQRSFRHEMRTDYAKLKEWVRTEVDEFHEYLVRQEGYKSGIKDSQLKSQIRTGDIKISNEAWWLIVKIVGFVGTALTIIGILINAKK